MDTLPDELVQKIAGILAEDDDDVASWWAFGWTCWTTYDLILKPAIQRCEAYADNLMQQVEDRASHCYSEDAIEYYDDSYYSSRKERRDGVYVYEDQVECDAFPGDSHLHHARCRYTRFARDIDIWECTLDGRSWKIMG